MDKFPEDSGGNKDAIDFVEEGTIPLDPQMEPGMAEMDMFDLDIYGDLAAIDMSQELTYPELKKLYEESQRKIKELAKENQILKEQNVTLKKNISSLYLTAREEIQRKDSQLRAQQDKEMKRRVAHQARLQETGEKFGSG